MREKLAIDTATPEDKGNPADDLPTIPPDPTRDALEPLLRELYVGDRLPDVRESQEPVGELGYAISNPGVLAIVELKPGLSDGDKAKAIIRGVAEADAFAVRNDADRYFPEQLTKIKNSFGAEERDRVRAVYTELRLLDFFASDKADAAIAKLDGAVKTAATELKDEYLGKKDAIWSQWMSIKMFARRDVAYDQPFKPVLRSLRKVYGMSEPEPITWESAHDPEFAAWAKTIDDDDELFKMLTNLAELKDQEEFRGDTHARWTMEGSANIPEVAKGVKLDKELGFGVHREDLGGGYQEMTFVFSKKLAGAKLKEAYLRSLIYRQVFTDFATLSAAGGDFENGEIPDEHDPAYAYCGSQMAYDGMVKDFAADKPLLEGLTPSMPDEEKLVSRAVECVLARVPTGINRGVEDDVARPPAPATRNAFFQMLARFTKVDVNLDNMKKDIEKTAEVEDAEAFLKGYDKKRKEEMDR
ncbi:hypothetical protein ACNOYE_13745 [Nannocystaceae bacterium ST9]